MYNICTYIGLQKRDISVTYNICVSILKPSSKKQHQNATNITPITQPLCKFYSKKAG